MTNALLLVCFGAVAVLGFFLMARVDAFFEQNRRVIAKEKTAPRAHPVQTTEKEVHTNGDPRNK